MAERFGAAVKRGERLEPSTYYALQRDCLEALAAASVPERPILFIVASLAEMLGRELDEGAIDAAYEKNWRDYASSIEALLNTDVTGAPTKQVLAMSNAIRVIYPPRGRPA